MVKKEVGLREHEVLRRLDAEIGRRLPQWRERGAEDPARVLLETFALRLAELDGRVEELSGELLPRLLSALGEEPLWPRPARTVLRLHASDDAGEAIRVPAGTGVTSHRVRNQQGGTSSSADGLDQRLYFETAADAWVTPAKLEAALVLEGESVRDVPIERDRADAVLFEADRLRRFLLLGDPAWNLIQGQRGDIILEWPESPPIVADGDWEYSVGTGWRLLPVDFSETTDSGGERLLRMRITGPLPDLTRRVIEGAEIPWFRLSLDSGGRATLPVPTIAWLPKSGRVAGTKGTDSDGGGRAVARLFLESGESYEDVSFSDVGRVASRPIGAAWQPTVYFGWERASAGSLCWMASGRTERTGEACGSREAPRLVWEYSAFREFRPLDVDDQSRSFTRPGTIGWSQPDDWASAERFGRDLFWIRARWVGGAYLERPRVDGVWPSAVEIIEGRERIDHSLRLVFDQVTQPSGDARSRSAKIPEPAEGAFSRFDRLEVSDSSVGAGGWRSFVHAEDELDVPGTFRLRREIDGAVSVRVTPAPSGAVEAKVPRLRVGLRRAASRAGEGKNSASTEVPAGTLDVLEVDTEREFRSLSRVSQPLDSWGGRAIESPDEFYRRVDAGRRSAHRAVTVADYRALVRFADSGIGRVEVVTSRRRPSEVWIVVFSAARGGDGPGEEVSSFSPRRLALLGEFLEERSSLGTVVRVVEPIRVPFRLSVSFAGRGQAGERREMLSQEESRDIERLEREIRSWLSPLSGGSDGRGVALASLFDERPIVERLRRFDWGGSSEGRVRCHVTSELGDEVELDVAIGIPSLASVDVSFHEDGVEREEPNNEVSEHEVSNRDAPEREVPGS